MQVVIILFMRPTQIRYSNARILEKGKTAFVLNITVH
jgi:hypothetical protein